MFKFWIENDINPVIIFNYNKEIEFYNQAAEILLSYINKNDIFEFIVSNLKDDMITEFKRVKFLDFVFSGYTIGVFNYDYIGVRFFIDTSLHKRDMHNIEKVNVLQLLEFIKNYFSLKNIDIKIYYDPSIPEFFINKKELLNLIFEIIDTYDSFISIKIDIGEYMLVDSKKHQIVEIIIKNDNQKEIDSKCFDVVREKDMYIIKLPLLMDKE